MIKKYFLEHSYIFRPTKDQPFTSLISMVCFCGNLSWWQLHRVTNQAWLDSGRSICAQSTSQIIMQWPLLWREHFVKLQSRSMSMFLSRGQKISKDIKNWGWISVYFISFSTTIINTDKITDPVPVITGYFCTFLYIPPAQPPVSQPIRVRGPEPESIFYPAINQNNCRIIRGKLCCYFTIF